MPRRIKIGLIGGTGLDDPQLLENRTEKHVTTVFGDPSDALILGQISGVDVVLLARHGRKHNINPTNVNYRANILALKNEGCTHILVSAACGSLVEEAHPGDFVVLDQFIDRTTKRNQTFYDGSLPEFPGVAHIPVGDPFSEDVRQVMLESLAELEFPHLKKGAIVVIEGPRYSTRAESNMYRQWGGTVIGMTTVPEVVLAKEAGLLYAAVGLVTDYDCWKEDAESVSVDFVDRTMKANAAKAIQLFTKMISKIAARNWDDVIMAAETMAKSSIM